MCDVVTSEFASPEVNKTLAALVIRVGGIVDAWDYGLRIGDIGGVMGGGVPCPFECDVLTLTLRTLHGKRRLKVGNSSPPPCGAVPPLVIVGTVSHR